MDVIGEPSALLFQKTMSEHQYVCERQLEWLLRFSQARLQAFLFFPY